MDKKEWLYEEIKRDSDRNIIIPTNSYSHINPYLIEKVDATKIHGVYYPDPYNSNVTDLELNPKNGKITLPTSIKKFPIIINNMDDLDIFYMENNERINVKKPSEWCGSIPIPNINSEIKSADLDF